MTASESNPPSAPRTRGSVVVDVDACKGCELCVEACPPGVLRMTSTARNNQGYLYPELLPGCIACGLCAKVCPDFVFQVWRFDTPVTELELVSSADAQ